MDPTAKAVENTFALIFRVQEQLNNKKRDLRTITDCEIVFVEENNSYKIIQQAIEQLPESAQSLFETVLPLCKEGQKAFETTLEFCAKQLAENLPHFEEKLKFERKFPLKQDFHFKSVLTYEDDVVVCMPYPLPGLAFRMRQGIVSFYQQIEQHCCLSDPSGSARIYPHETRAGARIATRSCVSDHFFNKDFSVPHAAVHYATAFIEEITVLGPELFPPWARLPLIVPTGADLLACTAPAEAEVD